MMKTSFMKLLTSAIILLFIGIAYAPSITANNPTSTRTIYVDDDNVDGPWDGSLEHPFQNIQNAINAPIDSDIVFVFNGTYRGNVDIWKSIVLQGENKESTNIFGRVHIFENNVKISGFSIQNSYYGVKIYKSKGNTIFGNIISDISIGIHIESSENNLISNNTIFSATLFGIWLVRSGNNIICDNRISNNKWGIAILFSDAQILRNDISSNEKYGICIEYHSASFPNIISGNNIQNNEFGIKLYYAECRQISNNNIMKNDEEVFFTGFVVLSTKWKRNYWGRPRVLPKLIPGEGYITTLSTSPIHLFNFDWHPAKEPYDIPPGGA